MIEVPSANKLNPQSTCSRGFFWRDEAETRLRLRVNLTSDTTYRKILLLYYSFKPTSVFLHFSIFSFDASRPVAVIDCSRAPMSSF